MVLNLDPCRMVWAKFSIPSAVRHRYGRLRRATVASAEVEPQRTIELHSEILIKS